MIRELEGSTWISEQSLSWSLAEARLSAETLPMWLRWWQWPSRYHSTEAVTQRLRPELSILKISIHFSTQDAYIPRWVTNGCAHVVDYWMFAYGSNASCAVPAEHETVVFVCSWMHSVFKVVTKDMRVTAFASHMARQVHIRRVRQPQIMMAWYTDGVIHWWRDTLMAWYTDTETLRRLPRS